MGNEDAKKQTVGGNALDLVHEVHETVQTTEHVVHNSALTLVQKEVGDIEPGQLLDAYKAVNEASDKRFKLKKVLAIWRLQQKNDRTIRKSVVYMVTGALLFEIFVAFLAFFCIGFGWIHITDPWIGRTFFVTVLGHVIAILTIIVRNLFPERNTDNLADITAIVEKL
ncbi:MAG TPA: hypothetical protein VFV52_16190 [Bacilli bacterium]|nr:hypothetical protein [Bacilli bacterium]